MNSEKVDEQKDLAEKYQSTSMSLEKFNLSMDKIESKYSVLREDIEDEQSRVMNLMNDQQEKSILDFTKNYESDSEMTIVWNSSVPEFTIR